MDCGALGLGLGYALIKIIHSERGGVQNPDFLMADVLGIGIPGPDTHIAEEAGRFRIGCLFELRKPYALVIRAHDNRGRADHHRTDRPGFCRKDFHGQAPLAQGLDRPAMPGEKIEPFRAASAFSTP